VGNNKEPKPSPEGAPNLVVAQRQELICLDEMGKLIQVLGWKLKTIKDKDETLMHSERWRPLSLEGHPMRAAARNCHHIMCDI
jgi:hypothetical protein